MTSKKSRPPVVVVLGHVDHGKTTLLDTIRKTNIVQKEAGSITQKIGAYEVVTGIEGYDVDRITFIDTPGHEAFSKLRSRGATVADIAILIVDATDSVKPQTIESIQHITSLALPFVVAINKIDLPNAQVDKVKKDLSKHGVYLEGNGGTTPSVGISALKGTGLKDLLEALLFIAAEKKLEYDAEGELEAYVIETRQGSAGIEASCIIKNGTLSLGETVYAGDKEIKVKAMIDDTGARLKHVTPSQPFVLLGSREFPDVGVGLTRRTVVQEVAAAPIVAQQSLDDFFSEEVEKKKLKLLIKADTAGSLEAILGLLQSIDAIEVLDFGVGEITKSDISMCKVTKSIVIGFGVKVSKDAIAFAKQERVLIKSYDIIYELVEELTEVAALMEEKEKEAIFAKGEAKILMQFIIEGQKIAGVSVQKGKISQGDRLEIYRDTRLIGTTQAASIQQRAKTVKELSKSQEGGIALQDEIDFKVGDVVKSYSI